MPDRGVTPPDSAYRFAKRPVIFRIERQIKVVDRGYKTPCWVWTGYSRVTSRGGPYGYIKWRKECWGVHRLIYKLFVGPLIDGLEVDHLCRVTLCINPDHLEQVTHQNTYRQKPDNNRSCKICRRKAFEDFQQRKLAS